MAEFRIFEIDSSDRRGKVKRTVSRGFATRQEAERIVQSEFKPGRPRATFGVDRVTPTTKHDEVIGPTPRRRFGSKGAERIAEERAQQRRLGQISQDAATEKITAEEAQRLRDDPTLARGKVRSVADTEGREGLPSARFRTKIPEESFRSGADIQRDLFLKQGDRVQIEKDQAEQRRQQSLMTTSALDSPSVTLQGVKARDVLGAFRTLPEEYQTKENLDLLAEGAEDLREANLKAGLTEEGLLTGGVVRRGGEEILIPSSEVGTQSKGLQLFSRISPERQAALEKTGKIRDKAKSFGASLDSLALTVGQALSPYNFKEKRFKETPLAIGEVQVTSRKVEFPTHTTETVDGTDTLAPLGFERLPSGQTSTDVVQITEPKTVKVVTLKEEIVGGVKQAAAGTVLIGPQLSVDLDVRPVGTLAPLVADLTTRGTLKGTRTATEIGLSRQATRAAKGKAPSVSTAKDIRSATGGTVQIDLQPPPVQQLETRVVDFPRKAARTSAATPERAVSVELSVEELVGLEVREAQSRRAGQADIEQSITPRIEESLVDPGTIRQAENVLFDTKVTKTAGKIAEQPIVNVGDVPSGSVQGRQPSGTRATLATSERRSAFVLSGEESLKFFDKFRQKGSFRVEESSLKEGSLAFGTTKISPIDISDSKSVAKRNSVQRPSPTRQGLPNFPKIENRFVQRVQPNLIFTDSPLAKSTSVSVSYTIREVGGGIGTGKVVRTRPGVGRKEGVLFEEQPSDFLIDSNIVQPTIKSSKKRADIREVQSEIPSIDFTFGQAPRTKQKRKGRPTISVEYPSPFVEKRSPSTIQSVVDPLAEFRDPAKRDILLRAIIVEQAKKARRVPVKGGFKLIDIKTGKELFFIKKDQVKEFKQLKKEEQKKQTKGTASDPLDLGESSTGQVTLLTPPSTKSSLSGKQKGGRQQAQIKTESSDGSGGPGATQSPKTGVKTGIFRIKAVNVRLRKGKSRVKPPVSGLGSESSQIFDTSTTTTSIVRPSTRISNPSSTEQSAESGIKSRRAQVTAPINFIDTISISTLGLVRPNSEIKIGRPPPPKRKKKPKFDPDIDIDLPDRKRKRKPTAKKTQQFFKFNPKQTGSLVAGAFNIGGRFPTTVTGLEVRPLKKIKL